MTEGHKRDKNENLVLGLAIKTFDILKLKTENDFKETNMVFIKIFMYCKSLIKKLVKMTNKISLMNTLL